MLIAGSNQRERIEDEEDEEHEVEKQAHTPLAYICMCVYVHCIQTRRRCLINSPSTRRNSNEYACFRVDFVAEACLLAPNANANANQRSCARARVSINGMKRAGFFYF